MAVAIAIVVIIALYLGLSVPAGLVLVIGWTVTIPNVFAMWPVVGQRWAVYGGGVVFPLWALGSATVALAVPRAWAFWVGLALLLYGLALLDAALVIAARRERQREQR